MYAHGIKTDRTIIAYIPPLVFRGCTRVRESTRRFGTWERYRWCVRDLPRGVSSCHAWPQPYDHETSHPYTLPAGTSGLHQARSAVRCWARRMKGEMNPTNNRLCGDVRIWMAASNKVNIFWHGHLQIQQWVSDVSASWMSYYIRTT